MSVFLGIAGKREADLEGAARIGNQIFWIASHGRDSKGALSPDRHRFFATAMTTSGAQLQLQPIGQPYRGLLEDLHADARLRPFSRDRASQLAPKLPGALNIEGLAGHYGDEGVSRLYEWPEPGSEPVLIEGISFSGSNPASIVFDTVRGTQDLFVLSDDGGLDIDGVGARD